LSARALARLSEPLDLPEGRPIPSRRLYVTVDPARDTPAVMKAYLQQRHPRFTGLTGSREKTEQAKQVFGLTKRALPPVMSNRHAWFLLLPDFP
jgi:protein SCO1/2